MSRTIPCYAMRGALKAALLALVLAVLAVAMFGCAAPIELAEGCPTDSECMAQCLDELRSDEDPATCEISLAPYLKEHSALLASHL